MDWKKPVAAAASVSAFMKSNACTLFLLDERTLKYRVGESKETKERKKEHEWRCE